MTRSIAFALAYGGLVAIALVARYDAPSLAFARAALARGDLGAAEEAAQVVINEDPSRASAARTLLDDARERRMTAANDIATAATQLSLPWANANRRQALAQQWLARIDRDTRAAIEQRDFTKLSQIASATRSFDATRSTYASNAGTLIAQSRSTPGEAPCAATLPSDGPFAALRTEYLARVRARAEEVIASVRANQGSPERWTLVVGLTRCLEQMGQSASMTAAALEQAHRAETAREEARLAAARAAAIRAMNNSSDDDSGGSYGGYGGSTYVNGYYRRGRYVRGYYRRRR
ncbi:MAG: hypothetical protein JNK05_39940 [Myxococcales bacterium]|nr:hypothetical protein [Myxococcales bacterium]